MGDELEKGKVDEMEVVKEKEVNDDLLSTYIKANFKNEVEQEYYLSFLTKYNIFLTKKTQIIDLEADDWEEMKKDMKKEDKNSSLLIILLQKLRKRVQSAPITTTGTITPADLQLKTVDEVINYYESLKTGNILDKILNKKRSLVNTDFSFRTRDNIDNELRTEAALQFQASLNTTQKKRI